MTSKIPMPPQVLPNWEDTARNIKLPDSVHMFMVELVSLPKSLCQWEFVDCKRFRGPVPVFVIGCRVKVDGYLVGMRLAVTPYKGKLVVDHCLIMDEFDYIRPLASVLVGTAIQLALINRGYK